MDNKKSRGAGRTRNFATVIYIDSASQEWKEKLEQFFVPAFISPLHENDVNPDGTTKKPHWHVMIMFDSVKTNEQAKEVFNAIGGVGLEKLTSFRGYARYLCHLDNPEKTQYSPEDVQCLCGADYIGAIGLATDKYKAIGEMIDFCEKSDIDSYAELLIYCRMHRFDWFRVLCDNGTVVMREFLKSRTWTNERKTPPTETGVGG